MADISMCLNEACPKKFSCYRYTATPTPRRQSYMGFNLTVGKNGIECDGYYPNENKVTISNHTTTKKN